jgi:uncharacterized damage-inducible protein DinB
MTHPLVAQLRFTRSEFKRAIEGVSEAEARRRFMPMNCISWTVGHMASQEQRYWLYRFQDRLLLPEVHEQFNYGAPSCTPPLAEVWESWGAIVTEVDPWLDALTTQRLHEPRTINIDGEPFIITAGSLLQRVIYHYWYHTGENMAIRQLLGHRNLPEFVGNIDDDAPYTPE